VWFDCQHLQAKYTPFARAKPDKPEPDRLDKPSALLMGRVDKRSASTIVAAKGGCAALVHPTILLRK